MSHLDTAYKAGAHDAILSFEKEANIGRAIKQLQMNVTQNPVARAEMLRQLIGGGAGAVAGGATGYATAPEGSGGLRALLGGALGGIGGAGLARGAGRLAEHGIKSKLISKATPEMKNIPFGTRTSWKNEAMTKVVPRLSPEAKAGIKGTKGAKPTKPPKTKGKEKGQDVNIPAAAGAEVGGNIGIPAHLAEQMRAAGMM